MSEKESVLRRFRKVTLFTFVLGESVSLKGWVLILAEEIYATTSERPSLTP